MDAVNPGDTYGTALFLPKSFCSQSSSVDMAATSFSLTFLRGRVLLKVLELVTNGDCEPLANPLRTPLPEPPLLWVSEVCRNWRKLSQLFTQLKTSAGQFSFKILGRGVVTGWKEKNDQGRKLNRSILSTD